ncbi:nitroreductase family protein [Cohnella hongkongensis]|uniref:Nitroreductase family protein n=1 Tax=Cohnella hongkongensis TaxID=178337 RepID=A0ABV9FB40_9BACL
MSIQPTMEQIRECGRFSERPVTAEQILALLEDAIWAPNHHLREPWRFIWVASDSRGKLEEALDSPTQNQLRTLIREAPACLIVAAPVPQDAREAKDDFAAACCLIQNLQILASAAEIGMSWHLPLGQEDKAFGFAAELRLDERVVGVLGFGYWENMPSKAPEKPPIKIEVW